jgi:hypothetical protein
MGQENPKETKIPISVKRLLEKRDALISKNEDELSKIEEDGIITKREARRISRNSRDIQNFDTRLQRSGFIPAQTLLPTSKTTQIAIPQGQFEQSSAFNVSPRRIGGGGTAAAQSHPFKISFTAPNEITVNAGTINDLLASGGGGFFNDDGSLKQFAIGTGLSYVILSANSDGRKFTSCSIQISSSPPQVQEPTLFSLPLTAQFTIGLTYNGRVHQIIYNNITVSGRQQYIADKVIAAEAGQLPYEIYYVWR